MAREAGAEVANYNAPDQTTVSGSRDSIERAMELAKARGKASNAASGERGLPFVLMGPAAADMRPLLQSVPMQPAAVPLVGNVRPGRWSIPQISDRSSLSRSAVPFAGRTTSTRCASRRDTFYEVGPGKVLAGLIARCDPAAEIYSAERLLAQHDAVSA